MKKAITIGIVGSSLFNVAAHAQSSVTLYGVIDEGFNYTSNVATPTGGKQLYNLSSGVLQGSRFGFRGTEDLGSGLKAIFILENGFDVNNGRLSQGGLLFGRQANVGLSSSKFGTVTLGRQYDSVVDYASPMAISHQWAGYIGAHPGDIDNFNNGQRTNNAIKYTSPNIAGVTFGGLYSLGGIAGNITQNQVWSLGASYAGAGLTAGVGYLNVRNANVGFFGSSSSTTLTSATANSTTPVISGFMSAHTYQVFGAGAAYTIGSATVGATYSYTQFAGLGDTATSGPNPSHYKGAADFNNAEVNFRYQVTPALLLGIAYDYTKGGSTATTAGPNPGATYHQGSIGADYLLSKRTDVYFIGVLQKASGTDSTNKPAVAAINGLTASTSDRQTALRIGIRHKF
ncbi:porin [Paraburkholderia sp. BL9I2N2]|uniref:porin n=1 Tax=Paraburkholderia sp. BL9I2N2 TaxID=1938809 RepID=UPI001042CEDE|nr:porin [Paraburkholderia sp. BL9I2N2]TCK84143.1 putative porin [Paraburkholderia sp. BL9I2N2]